MKRELRITPKQLRGLVLLLLLLPVIPSVALVRVVADTFHGLREQAVESYAQSLLRQMARAAERAESEQTLAAGDVEAVEAFFENALGPAVAVAAVDAGRWPGGVGAADAVEIDGGGGGGGVLRVRRTLGDRFGGRTLEASIAERAILPPSMSRQMGRTWRLVWIVVAGVPVAGAVAGLAVYRQLRSEEMKSDFLATVSHELKTPVASIRLLVDTLRNPGLLDEPARNEYLDLIGRENDHLQATLERFLAYWRLEQKREHFSPEWVPAEAIASAAVDTVRPRVDARGGFLEVRVRPLISDLKVDRQALTTVISNLLDNAVKYSPDPPEVTLDVFQSGDSMFFQVGDKGIGVPVAERKRIFDHFYRVDRSLSRRTGGCGLGLSIARMIVEAHQGSIGVTERLRGAGSIFWVRLPLELPFPRVR